MSLRSRLLLLTLLAAAIPALLELTRFLQERERAIEADTAALVLMAQRHAEALGERIRGTAQLHFGLARAGDLLINDRDACSAFLSEVREAHPQYTGILTIKPDGSLFCDSLRTGRELDLRDRGYFQAALKAHNEVLLEPVFGRLTGVAVLQIAYPVRSESGELRFVLLASLNLQRLTQMEALPVPGAALMLVDHKGMVLAKSSTANTRLAPGTSIDDTPLFHFASQRALRTSEVAEPGASVGVWAVADLPAMEKAGLHVLAGAPRSALVGAANRRFQQNMVFVAAAAVGIFLAVWLVAEIGIRRQVARITHMAERLSAGDLTARIAPPLPRGELGALMAVLNETAQSLQQQRAAIEQLNERLRQSQRLEAIGQLTGGVAHDFNNLLTVVMGNAELLAAQSGANPQHRALAETIGHAAQRGAELTGRLLAFARKQALDPKVVDVNRLLADMEPILRRTLGAHVEVGLRPGVEVWPALVDQGQLENALLNLCLNARDAMPEGGRLTLETANVWLDADYADRFPDVRPGAYVRVAVSDTGEGIAPEHLRRIFEPFFTTKGKGKGTGLGLAMVYGFVKQSVGHVSIYSEPGQGTTVKLYLPRAVDNQAKADDPPPEDAMAAGSETILLVEDDDSVRRYAGDQLRSFGYEVVEAADGQAALAIVAQRNDIHLLFTDIVMPGGMNGRALADAARQLRPALPVLYTSGYTEDAIVHDGRLDPGALLLSKPYRRSDLHRAVRAALAQGQVPRAAGGL